MGTRSAIGYLIPSGKIIASYCHWDGHPDHQMPILKEHYISYRLARALVRLGSMSSLRTDRDWEGNEKVPGPLYHAERGDGDPPHQNATVASAQKYWRDQCDCEHMYIYMEDMGGWEHYRLT